jgi:hypothetical protein
MIHRSTQAKNGNGSDTNPSLSPKRKGESKMKKFGKYFLLTTAFAFLATFARIPGTITKVHAHNGPCSVASLNGTYAYLRSGFVMAQGPRAELGLHLFNGDGKRGIIRNTGASYTVSFDWTNSPWPNGTYTVDEDCTGSLYEADGTKANNIIVLDRGKRYLVLTAGPTGEGKVITGEATKLDEEKD